MKVTQEKLPASQISLEIEIPAADCKQAYEKVVKNLLRVANIPGFRKGKVPRQILLQRLGSQRIKAEALESLIQDSLKQALEQEELEALGNYRLSSDFEELLGQYSPEKELIFSASVDVPPQVKVSDYQGLSVTAEEIKYNPSQVDEFLEQNREKQATLVPVEGRPAQMGDVTVVDYSGKRTNVAEGEEEKISGAQATDAQVELKDGLFIADLLAGIVGMNAEESKEIPVKFPDDYPHEELSGVEAVFSVTLKEIKEKELPELDDDFAQDVSEFETMAELRESLESQFQEQAEQKTTKNIEDILLQELVKLTEVDLPLTMVEQELESILTQKAMQFERYGMDVKKIFTQELVNQMKQSTRPEAVQNLTQSLALLEVAKLESLKPEAEEVDAKIKEVTEQMPDRNFDPERLRDLITEDVTKEKVLTWLREKATVELVPEGSLAAENESETEEESPEEASEATVETSAEVVESED